jgi:hypothetical protein
MRRTSRMVSIVTLFGLLFLQGALAAHACSVTLDSRGGLVSSAGADTAPDDCARMMDQAAAALCLKHCSQGSDASNTLTSVDVPAPALTAFLLVESAPEKAFVTSWAPSPPAAHNNSPPPLLLSQRLRI